MRKTSVVFLFLLTSLCTPASSSVAYNNLYLVAVKQVIPDGESTAIACEENAKNCSLKVKLATSEAGYLKVDVLISSGEAYFKFKYKNDYLEGNHLRHFHVPVGRARHDKTVTLYYHPPSDPRSPVLKYSNRSVAQLKITIMPKTIDY